MPSQHINNGLGSKGSEDGGSGAGGNSPGTRNPVYKRSGGNGSAEERSREERSRGERSEDERCTLSGVEQSQRRHVGNGGEEGGDKNPGRGEWLSVRRSL